MQVRLLNSFLLALVAVVAAVAVVNIFHAIR